MIEHDPDVPTALAVLEGAPCELSCRVRASERPSIAWILPDGSALLSPSSAQDGRDSDGSGGGRLSILPGSGGGSRLRIRAAERGDAGLYRCVAAVPGETDSLAFRVAVLPRTAVAAAAALARVTKNPGESLALPCRALAVPEAQLSWVLPSQAVVSASANASGAYVLANGTLWVPELRAGDGGYYRCVAVNMRGSDQLTVAVTVSRRAPKRGRRPGAGDTAAVAAEDGEEGGGGSGAGPGDKSSGRTPHLASHRKGRRRKQKASRRPQAAEGRRGFQARRRVHVASKQINPDHWAHILARVRGRNPVPTGRGAAEEEGPEEAAVETATETAAAANTAPSRPSPVASPPSASPGAAGADEFSADALLPGEEEAEAVPGPTVLFTAEAGAAAGSSSHLWESVDDDDDDDDDDSDEFSEETQGVPRRGGDAPWNVATTGPSGVPRGESSSMPPILRMTYEESASGRGHTDNWSTQAMGDGPTRATDDWSTRATDDWSTRATNDWSTQATNDWSTRATDDWSTQATNDWSTRATNDWSTRATNDWSTRATNDWSTRATDDWSTQATNDWSTRATNDWSTRATNDWSTRATDDWSTRATDGWSTQATNDRSTRATDDWSTRATNDWTTRATNDWPTRATNDWPSRATDDWSTRDVGPTAVATEGESSGAVAPTPASSAADPRAREGAGAGARKLPEGVTTGRAPPAGSRGSERERFAVRPAASLGSLAATATADEDIVKAGSTAPTTATTPAVTTPPSRKRPHSGGGRRKLRPHRFRERHKLTTHTPTTHTPTTLAPAGDFSPGRARDPEAATTSWGERTAGTPEWEAAAEGAPRRRQGRRRPGKHGQATSSAAGAPASPTEPSPSPRNTPVGTATGPRPETAALAPTAAAVSPETGRPRGATGAAASKVPPSASMALSTRGGGGGGGVSSSSARSVDADKFSRGDGSAAARGRDPRVLTPTPFPPTAPVAADLTSTVTVYRPPSPPPPVSTDSSDSVEAPDTHTAPTKKEEEEGEEEGEEKKEEEEEEEEGGGGRGGGERGGGGGGGGEGRGGKGAGEGREGGGGREGGEREGEKEKEEEEQEETQPTWWPRHDPTTPSPKAGVLRVTPNQAVTGKDERTAHTLLRGPEGHHQHHHPPDGSVRALPTHPARVSIPPVPPRGTRRPPPWTTRPPFGYPVTARPPQQGANRPGVTVSPWRVLRGHKPSMVVTMTTTAATPRPTSPSPGHWLPGHGTDATHGGHARASGSSNTLPDVRPSHPPNARFPFFDGTFRWPPWGVAPKMRTPAPPAPAGTPRQAVRPFAPDNRIVTHVDWGPPAPPSLPRPRIVATVSPPPPPLPSTRVPSVVTAPPRPPSGTSRPAGPRIFSAAGGPPAAAPKLWALGEAPKIVTKSPLTVTVVADSDAAIPCEATGKPEPFVTWSKVSTGALLTPNTRVQRFQVLRNGTFLIHRAQPQDRGQYVCTAQNLHGADRRSVLLSVSAQHPQILPPPPPPPQPQPQPQYKDITVSLGDTITMECLAKGSPAPQISWIFPDRRVWREASPAEGRVTLYPNRTLTIRDATFSDRGAYRCVASNAGGADSLAIRLHVTALPPLIQQDKLENITLAPGVSVHVHCVTRGAPSPSVRWALPDGTPIRPTQFLRGNLFVFPNGTLYIRNLGPKDAGRYECVAANLVGSARRTVVLTVRSPPAAAANARITGTSPQRTDVRYGETLRLDCSASGDPWPRILWRLPSKQMVDSFFSSDPRIRVFANGTLTVHAVTEGDSGDYLCVARNKAGGGGGGGDDSAVLGVKVVTRPARIERSDSGDGRHRRVPYGGDLRVDCVASGLPNPEISWSLPDGSLLHPFPPRSGGGGGGGGVIGGARSKRHVVFHNGTLYLNEVGLPEEGAYTCVAENRAGRDAMTVRVQVVTAPPVIRDKTPHSVAVVRVPYGDTASVPCEAQGEPRPTVTWLSPANTPVPPPGGGGGPAGKSRVYRDGALLVIRKAQRADGGTYTCVARSAAGEDRMPVRVQVRVRAPSIDGSAVSVVTAREGARALVDCLARGVPAPRVLWALPEGVVLPAPYFGNRVTVHRNGTLDIRGVRKSDAAARLACVARNEGGEARMDVRLSVTDAAAAAATPEPPALRDPADETITAAAGHTIGLNCSAASGVPAPSLLWVLPDGTRLPGGRRLRRFFHEADGGTLRIGALAAADAGTYRCEASSAAGRAERRVSLRVVATATPPDAKEEQPHRALVSVAHGATLELRCPLPSPGPRLAAAAADGGAARVSWTLPNGATLRAPQAQGGGGGGGGGRVSARGDGTLTVREASVFDRGTYACRASDGGAPAASFAVIVIAYPPRITGQPAPLIHARPGATVTLDCAAVALPAAQVAWELPDGSRLAAAAAAGAGAQARPPYGRRSLHPRGSLTVRQATARDAGFYRCTATNVLGTDSKATYVHVY